MKLLGKQRKNSTRWDVSLTNVTPHTVVELRIQNTNTGRQVEQYVESDSEGVALVDLPDFGQHYSITARVLTDDNGAVLHRLFFDLPDDNEQRVNDHTKLSMSANEEVIPPTEQPQRQPSIEVHQESDSVMLSKES